MHGQILWLFAFGIAATLLGGCAAANESAPTPTELEATEPITLSAGVYVIGSDDEVPPGSYVVTWPEDDLCPVDCVLEQFRMIKNGGFLLPFICVGENRYEYRIDLENGDRLEFNFDAIVIPDDGFKPDPPPRHKHFPTETVD